MQRYRVPKGFFGAAGSPLVEDGRVLANVGGPNAGIVAFDAKTGQALWTATNDEASYSSAAGATIAGRRVAIFLTRAGLVGLDPASGKVQFQRPWRARMAASVNVATPLVIGDLLFVSAGAGQARVSSASTARRSTSSGRRTRSSRTITRRAFTTMGTCMDSTGARSLARASGSRTADREGALESGSISGGNGDARRRSARDSARARRARPCAGDPRGLRRWHVRRSSQAQSAPTRRCRTGFSTPATRTP